MLMDQKNPHGGDVYANKVQYDFSANISPLGTPGPVRDAVVQSAQRLCDYPDPYCRALRSALSAHLGPSADWIICGNGAAEVIFDFARALSPKRALIVTPTFCEYEQALARTGCEIVHFPLSREDGFTLPEGLSDAARNFDLLVLCNPNNPTGRAYPTDQMLRLAGACAASDTRLFVDECFCDLTDEPEAHALFPHAGDFPNLFILKAFTKTYGLAGVRLGYGVCADVKLLAAMSEGSQAWNVSIPAQMAGVAALGCGDYVDEVRALVSKERAWLQTKLQNLGFTVYPSDVNFILFQSPKPLYAALLEKGILIRRCRNFPGLDEGDYRCAVRTRAENLALIGALEAILHG